MADPSTYQIRQLRREEIERIAKALNRPVGPDNTTGTYVGDELLMIADRALARELQSLIEATDDARKEIGDSNV